MSELVKRLRSMFVRYADETEAQAQRRRHKTTAEAADLIEKQDRLLGLYRKRDELLTEAVRRAFLFIADKKHITVVDGLYECSKKIDADNILEQIKQEETL